MPAVFRLRSVAKILFPAGVEQLFDGHGPLFVSACMVDLVHKIKGVPVRRLFSSWGASSSIAHIIVSLALQRSRVAGAAVALTTQYISSLALR